ncbi:MAG: class I SAM-dependent methyltransferase, partial [Lentisphaerae bacterium]
MSYNLTDYFHMVADSVRTRSYVRAIRQTLNGGETVLDLGSGIGIFGLVALQAGAKEVYAVDPNPLGMIGRYLAEENGLAQRYQFFCADARKLELPEPVDVIVTDMRGVLPIYGNHFHIINDVRQRFLKKGGKIIPLCDRLYAAPVSSARLYRELHSPWGRHDFGLDLRLLRQISPVRWQAGRVTQRQLLGPPALLAEFRYDQNLPEGDIRCHASWELAKEGTLHGLTLWFDCQLTDTVSFSSAPGSRSRPRVYGSTFFPLAEPVKCEQGARIRLCLEARRHKD